MRDRAVKCLMAVAVLGLLLPACQGTGGSKTPGANGSDYPRTQPGERLLGGEIEVESVVPPAEGGGEAKFVVRNVSGGDLTDLSATVILYSPPTGGVQRFDTEAVNLSFSVFRGETVTLSATAKHPEKVRGWVLRVQPPRTVKREKGVPGSTWLDGSLECVDIQGDPTEMVPWIQYTVENVGKEPLQLIEYRVVFKKGGKTVAKTSWLPVEGSIPPGGRATLKPDIGSLDVGSAEAVLQIRRGIL